MSPCVIILKKTFISVQLIVYKSQKAVYKNYKKKLTK